MNRNCIRIINLLLLFFPNHIGGIGSLLLGSDLVLELITQILEPMIISSGLVNEFSAGISLFILSDIIEGSNKEAPEFEEILEDFSNMKIEAAVEDYNVWGNNLVAELNVGYENKQVYIYHTIRIHKDEHTVDCLTRLLKNIDEDMRCLCKNYIDYQNYLLPEIARIRRCSLKEATLEVDKTAKNYNSMRAILGSDFFKWLNS